VEVASLKMDFRNYFALRDKFFEDHAGTLSRERLKVRMYCKTFEDYVQTARKYGFEIIEMEEARFNPEHLKESPTFFDSVNGVPLDLVKGHHSSYSNWSFNINCLPICSTNSFFFVLFWTSFILLIA
jgi:hypothetical protein